MEYYYKPFLNKSDIKRAYKAGYLDLVAKQLRRYGVITKQHDFEIDEGYHAGLHRNMSIVHHGIHWDIELHNGEVKSVGFKY
jgi:hypothetical protein